MLSRAAVAIAALVLGSPLAGAGDIWQSSLEVTGEGWARVFDGGPMITDSLRPRSFGVGFFASDATRLGSLGSSASTSGRAYEDPWAEQLMFTFSFYTRYSSSFFSGGDLSGGEAGGWLTSVIEVVSPGSQLGMGFWQDLDRAGSFTGSTSVVIENLTDSTTLLEWPASPTQYIEVAAHRGDLIRVTTRQSGEGSIPGGIMAHGDYGSDVTMGFYVLPEPGTVVPVALGALLLIRTRRR